MGTKIYKKQPLLKRVAAAMVLSSLGACSTISAQDWGNENGRVLVYGDAEGVGALFDGINGGNLISKMPPERTNDDNPYHEVRRAQDATKRMRYLIRKPVHSQKKKDK